MSDLTSQIEAQKANYGRGWDWLVDLIRGQISHEQNAWLKLEGKDRWEKSPLPFFEVEIHQQKEKFAFLRNYISFHPVEHDWSKFDKDDYDKKFQQINWQLHGYISGIESLSGRICEVSGERGEIRNLNGWMKCLSEKSFKEELDFRANGDMVIR